MATHVVRYLAGIIIILPRREKARLLSECKDVLTLFVGVDFTVKTFSVCLN